MRRRISGSVSTSGGRGRRDAADARDEAAGWADDRVPTWGAGDEERVARWLTARRGMPVPGSGGSAGSAPVRRADPWEAPVDLSALAGATVPAATPIVPPAGAGTVAAGGTLTTRPEAAAAAPVAPAPGVAGPRAALEAEVARLEEERRRLAVALAAERADAERVRSERALAAAMLEAQIAGLEDERRRTVARTEVAEAAAQRAAAEERAARASLQAARDEADALEARRLEEWITLDEEVAALTARRRRLRRLRHRCRRRAC